MTSLDALLKAAQKDNKKILSHQEEVELGKIIQSTTSTEVSKRKAVETLVLKNIFLVLKICHKYNKRNEFEFEDLVGYGILGLFTAAQKFDPSRKNRFASYARHWVKDAIMKAIREYSGLPKIPVYLVKNLWSITRILTENNAISDADLAERIGISEKEVIYLRSLMFKSIQFDVAYAAKDLITPEDEYILKERNKLIYEILHKILTANEFTVLAHTQELYGYSKMTFAQIKDELHLKNPRGLKARALRKLENSEIMRKLFEEG